MIAELGASEIAEVARALQKACGVLFSDPHGHALRSGFAVAATALRLDAPQLLGRLRSGDPAAVQTLVECTVVGETYFARHPGQLEALRAALRGLPGDRALHVWCAGCASGEEAYTVAMILLEEGRAGSASVLGTDVSEKTIAVAQRGRYGPWSLRALPAPARERWLRAAGAELEVIPEVSELVRFRRHNLISDPAPGVFGLVLCRNVLIYFDRPTAEGVVARLFDALRPGGIVALAPAEIPLAERLGFERLDHPGGALWRKSRAVSTRRSAREVRAARQSCTHATVSAPQDALHAARSAAAEGRWIDAERQACEVGERQMQPEAFLFAAAAAEARADLAAAIHWLGRALFLDPRHAVARASLVPLLERTGQRAEAVRARRQALEAIATVRDDVLLPGIEPVAAGALRSALITPHGLEVRP